MVKVLHGRALAPERSKAITEAAILTAQRARSLKNSSEFDGNSK